MKTGTKTNRQRGKRHQKEVAKLFGGIDVGIKGGEDVFHSKFSIECKSVLKFVVDKWYQQASNNNPDKDKRKNMVVVHLKNKSYLDDYVILKAKDFIELFNEII
ncbi:MAG: hypothetical protein AB7E45_00305 [Candidatus Caldatribacteriota bacterium]|jgi:hypothetical protein